MTADRRWWTLPKQGKSSASAELPAQVFGTVDRLRTIRQSETALDLIHEAIYLGRPVATAGRASMADYMRVSRSAPAVINVTQSKCDAVTARLSKRRPFPVISADESSWTERRFAKRASRVMRNRLGRTDLERMTPITLRDAVLTGTGVTKVFANDGDVAFERIPRSEILVDPHEARYGCPRQLFQAKSMPLEVLQAAYPEFKKELEAAAGKDAEDWLMRNGDLPDSDTREVYIAEGWHLPSSRKAKDGRHIISARGRVLVDEPWTRPRYPFAFDHWQPPIRGFWGRGLVETLAGPQAKINDIARDIQEALYYASQLVIFSPRGSGVNKEHLRGRHPRVVEYDGAIPSYVAPLPVSPQLFQFIEWLINMCDDLSGLSRDYQSGKTQLGAGASGKAMDTLYDIQSDRFALTELLYSLYRVDLGMLMIDAAREMWEDDDLRKSDLAPWIRDLPWRKVDIDDGNYHLKLEPINFIPDTRAGKLSAVNELAQAGLISDPMLILDLFDEPDLAAAFRIQLGPLHNIQRLLEGLDEPEEDLGEILPDSHWNLDLTQSFLKGAYNEAQAGRAPERILERYRYTMKWTKKLQDQAEEAKAQSQAPPPGASAADPMMAPPPAGPAMVPPGAQLPPAAIPVPA